MSIKKVTPASVVVDRIDERGSFQSSIYIDNRLGIKVGVKQRNGVNVVLPPKTRGAADGSLVITTEYRCQGKAQLNQLAAKTRDNTYLIAQRQPRENDGTSLRLMYKVTLDELQEKGGKDFYIEDLDIMLSLDPDEGIPDHSSESTLWELRSVNQDVVSKYGTSYYITADTGMRYGIVNICGRRQTLPVVRSDTPATLVQVRIVDDEIVESTTLLEERSVEYTDNQHTQDVTIDDSYAEPSFSDLYNGSMDSAVKYRSSVSKDLTKRLGDLLGGMEKANDAVRTTEIADLKHTNAMVNEGTKAVSSTVSAVTKIMEMMT
ncbi:MAG: hypothetical protein ACRDDY_13730 [Clostridium sp.]|uniref:hypothetical protein n=1 Tax=Clostridium sp. TaxID=1506 RepID=UPI003EE7AC62